jgi:hypothetical protein
LTRNVTRGDAAKPIDPEMLVPPSESVGPAAAWITTRLNVCPRAIAGDNRNRIDTPTATTRIDIPLRRNAKSRGA